MGHMREAETELLQLQGGDWLLVKKHLTAGETRRIYTRMIKVCRPGEPLELDPALVGLTQMGAYLVDWSITDPQNKVIPIKDRSPETITKILEDLPPDVFEDIRKAIDAHDAAMEAARAEEKKQKAPTISAAIS